MANKKKSALKARSKADRIVALYATSNRKCDIARRLETPYSYVNTVINRYDWTEV
jgi:hypothetical protein